MRRELRLRHRLDFQKLRQSGQQFRNKDTMLQITPNSLGHNRYGIIVSKRLGNAVQRNRIRRQLKAILTQRHPHLRQGYDTVWIARQSCTGKPHGALLRIVDDLLHQAAIVDRTHNS